MRELLSLNKYLAKYKNLLILGVLCVIFANILGALLPSVLRVAIDDAIFHGTHFNQMPHFLQAFGTVFLGYSALLLLLSIGKGIFTYLMRQYLIKTSRHIEFDLKNSIYNQFQKLGATFYQKHYTGDMMARIGEDVSNVRMYVGPVIMYVANLLFAFVTVIYQMLQVNTALSAWVLLPLPLLSFIIYLISKKIHTYTAKIQGQLSNISTFAQETFSGIRVIKSFAAQNHFENKLSTESQKYRQLNLKLAFINALFFPMMQLLMGLSTLLVLILGSKYVLQGNFSIGNFAEFILYLNMLIWPVASLGWTSALAQKAAASQKRLNHILQHPTEDINKGADFEFNQTLQFKNVSQKYEGQEKNTLHNINLEIPKATKIGIIGKTGSGKTTLLRSLLRELSVEGQICADGTDIANYSLASFRNKISYVPQDVYLFSDTIKNNIAMGSQHATHAKIDQVVKLAELQTDLKQFENGIDTLLGERGVSISGGQKQRVSIARALMADAEIFVLDDALSAIDSITEHRIIDNIYTYLNHKTVIIASHRIAAVAKADIVITLDQGKIAEIGSPQQLLASNGYFAKLHKLQTL